MSHLHLFRHAQASAGKANYDQLSSKGEEQAAILGNYLASKNVQFDKVYAGPLQRQQHTAHIVQACYQKQGRAFPQILSLEELREHRATEVSQTIAPILMKEDTSLQQIWQENQEQKMNLFLKVFKYITDLWVEEQLDLSGHPHLQRWPTFVEQVGNGMRLLTQEETSGQEIAAFTSAGTIATAVGLSFGLSGKQMFDLSWTVQNASYTTFRFNPQKISLHRFNVLEHLEEEMRTFI